jgi:hypothetical protein
MHTLEQRAQFGEARGRAGEVPFERGDLALDLAPLPFALVRRELADERAELDLGERVAALAEHPHAVVVVPGERALVGVQRRHVPGERLEHAAQPPLVVAAHALEHVRRRDRAPGVQRREPPLVAAPLVHQAAHLVEGGGRRHHVSHASVPV